MKDDRQTLAEIRVLWEKHLEEAEQELERARGEVKKFKAEIQSGSIRTPDVHYAYQQALRAENLALARYAKILVIVNDLTLHGKAPDDPESKCG
ncbi:MAG TPA: hypothetical protein VGF16_20350 [Bryobacteraceae bacterium]|jgi:hypothetical protein